MQPTVNPNARRARLRAGFTLVELLVVIAIIGILIGLLLPAVQAAREAARRVSCMNNMTQIGLAIHHHDFSLEHLPSGVINADGPIRNQEIGQDVSWYVQILPYIEQQGLFEHFDIQAGAYAPENADARASEVPTFLCPSFPGPAIVRLASGKEAASNSYAGCQDDHETPIDADNNGLLFLNSKIRFAEILDGSSQTILTGEVRPGSKSLGWASGTRATLRNTSSLNKGKWPQDCDVEVGSLDVGGFGSFHQGGALFTFADGSTRFLTNSIDETLFKQFGNRADGEILAR
ncbi:MAG: DUF1559 domain-containing protein [Rubripirellula sp.]